MEQLKPEKIAQIKELLKDMDINPANQSLIQDNKIIFPFKDKIYRVRMPNQNEQSLAEQAQNKLKIKLIQEDGNITRKQLIKALKEKQNIDIIELEKTKENIRKELQDVYLDLAMVHSDESEKLQELKEKKAKIESNFMDISIEISEMLTPCIEEQVKTEYYKYLAYVCLEKQVEKEKFEPVWKSYEEFGLDTVGLSYKAIENLQSLLLNIKE